MTPLHIDPQRLAVVLVDAEHAGNIGGAARAMGNLGLADLRLVRGVPLDANARAMACAFQDLLAGARQHPTLEAALHDCVFALALVSPMRARQSAPAPLRALRARMVAAAQQGNVALVFGSEQSGLAAGDVALCNASAAIVLPSPRPTLNLAQAVLLAGYEMLCVPESPRAAAVATTAAIAGAVAAAAEGERATHADIDGTLRTMSALLRRLDYGDAASARDSVPTTERRSLHDKILARCRAIAHRAVLTRADVQMLHGLLARLAQRLR